MLGLGTVLDPYQVATASDLNNVRNNLSAHYFQIADIDLSEYENWVPIGKTEDIFSFSGHYDGNDFTISNLTINDEDNREVGLFKKSENATFKNVTITNANVIGTYQEAGILCGLSINTELINCHTQGIITFLGDRAGGLVGGLFNYSEFSESIEYDVFNCSSICTFNQNSERYGMSLGGLFGVCDAKSIIQSYSICNIELGEGFSCVGGLIGDYYHNSPNSIISNCYSEFNFSAETFDNLGGLIGTIYDSDDLSLLLMEDCYAKGSLNLTSMAEEYMYNTGGLIGFIRGNPIKIKRCYCAHGVNGCDVNFLDEDNNAFIGNAWDEIVTAEDCYFDNKCGLSDNYAIPKTTAEMKLQSTFVDWDFDTIWAINPAINNGYPSFYRINNITIYTKSFYL